MNEQLKALLEKHKLPWETRSIKGGIPQVFDLNGQVVLSRDVRQVAITLVNQQPAVEQCKSRIKELEAGIEELYEERRLSQINVERLVETSAELQEVAALRGDNNLPHPTDDFDKLWTARMQTAWDEHKVALVAFQPNHFVEVNDMMPKYSRKAVE